MPPWIQQLWYGQSKWYRCLLPCSMVYRTVVCARKFWLTRFRQQHARVPIIVVGNLSLGGVGKTPLVIALAELMQQQGMRVGIVSRGYKSKLTQYPHQINLSDDPLTVGDEPYLLAKRTACPVVIAPKRLEAVNYLLSHNEVDVLLSDDGLQHYAMGREIEIAVIDGQRRLGNGACLPAGPLREPASRLQSVDYLLVNEGKACSSRGEYSMSMEVEGIFDLHSGELLSAKEFNQPVHAVTGIGNPERFFNQLNRLKINHTPHAFPDHHGFTRQDLELGGAIIMTEKDAVKCRMHTDITIAYVKIKAVCNTLFLKQLVEQLLCIKRLGC